MANTIQVNLEFTSDVSRARNAIKELQSTLNSVINSSMSVSDFGMTQQISQARDSAIKLKVALEQATNVKTGKLNLNQFNLQLQQSGMSIKSLASNMRTLGPEGIKAFNQMTQAMAMADTKVWSLGAGLTHMVKSLGNAMTYQIAYGAINAVTSSITKTIDYTKQLDKALTDIRMVTGKSAEEMNRFAISANQAAKSLSISTAKYAEAALIYYQQGLDGQAVLERANVTAKLANVTRSSAEEVSNWMTAIWNNFYDGSESLEYYADVLAKLGAATASSADEIAAGLEKFAAIAETVGLSYEYAASMLATITAETRQSAEVVGTALKTILSRMEGLKLGESLDDGTTLNKYSAALATIGVNIKDANGELKDMDQILDETAMRWSVLSRDQQVALAQAVAGIRQYSQFISLMDTWDINERNVEMARSSAGAMEEMYDGYVDSVEGMQERASASAEELMMSLLSSSDLKSFYKQLGDITEFITGLVNSMGGLQGILLQVGLALTKIYQPQIASFFNNLRFSVMDFKSSVTNFVHGNGFKSTRTSDMQQEAIRYNSQLQQSQDGGGVASAEMSEKIAQYKMKMVTAQDKLTAAEKEYFNLLGQIYEQQKKQLITQEKQADAASEKSMALRNQIDGSSSERSIGSRIAEFKAKGTVAVPKEVRMDPSSVSDNKRISFAQEANGIVDDLEQRNSELNLNISEESFDRARQVIQDFSNNAIQDYREVIEVIEDLEQKSKIDLNAEVIEDKKQQKLQGADKDYIKTQSDAFGEVQSSMDYTVLQAQDMAKVKNPNQSQKDDMASKLKASLSNTKDQAQTLGLDIKDDSFKTLETQIDSFAQESGKDINEVVAALQKLQKEIDEAGSKKLDSVVEESMDTSQEGKNLNKLSTIGLGADKDKSVESRQENINDLLKDSPIGNAMSSDGKTSLATKGKNLQTERKGIQKEIKALKEKNKLTKEEKKQLADLEKQLKKNDKATEDLEKEIRKETNSQKKNTKEEKKNTNEGTKNTKAKKQNKQVTEQEAEATDRAAKELREYANASADAQRQQSNFRRNLDNTTSGMDGLDEKLKGAGQGFSTFGDGISKGISGVASIAAGFVMAKSSMEELTYAIATGQAGVDDYVQSLSMMAPAILEMALPFIQLIGWIITKTAMSRASAKSAEKDADIEAKAEKKKQLSKAGTIMANIVEWITKGPGGWVIAGIGIAAAAILGITALAGAIGGGVSAGNERAEEEKKEKALEESRGATEAISAIGESGKELNGAIEGFKKLKNEGKSTKESMEEINETFSSFLDKIKTLENKYSINIDTTQLENAYNLFLKTGNIDSFETAYKKTQVQVAKLGLQKAKDTYYEYGTGEGTNDEDRAAYISAIDEYLRVSGGYEKLTEKMQTYWSNPKTSAQDLEQYWLDLVAEYIGMGAFKNPKVIAGIKNLMPSTVSGLISQRKSLSNGGTQFKGIYAQNHFKDENGELKEDHFSYVNSSGNTVGLGSTQMVAGVRADSDLAKGLTGYANDGDNKIKDVSELASALVNKNREDFIKWADDKGAKTITVNNKAYTSGDLWDDYHNVTEDNWIIDEESSQKLLNARAYSASLDPSLQTYALGIDYTQDESTWDTQLENFISEGKAQETLVEAENLGYDQNTFEAYAEMLATNNYELEHNSQHTKEVALNNLKASKGLSTLASSWNEVSEIIKTGNKNSMEYIQSIGSIKNALEEAFEYAPSTQFIEENFELIEKMIQNEEGALEDFQNKLAEDYVLNLDIEQGSIDIEEGRQALLDLLDLLDTSLEFGDQIVLGEGTEVSTDFLNAIQEMLDTGQITEEQLNNMLQAKGYTMEVTGYKWVNGALKSYTIGDQVDSEGNVTGETRYEQERIRVPIINGDTEGLIGGGTASIPTFTRSTTSSSLDTSSFAKNDKGSGKENKKIEDEIERYHEITKELEDIQRNLDRISEAKDRAFGANKLVLFNQQIEETENQITSLEEELRQVNSHLETDMANAMSWGIEIDPESGRIINYEEIMTEMVNKYNSGTLNEESYSQFLDDMSQYEETLSLSKDKANELIQVQNELFDLRLEKISYEIEIKVAVEDDELAYIEYQLGLIEDDAFAAAEAIGLIGQQTEANLNKLSAYEEGIRKTFAETFSEEEIQKLLNGDYSVLEGKELTGTQMEQLKEYRDGLIETNTELLKLQNNLQEKLVSAFEAWNEELQISIDKMSSYNEILTSYKDIIDLMGKDTLGISDSLMKDISDTTINNVTASIDAARQKWEASKQVYEDMQAEYNNIRDTLTEEDQKKWEETLKTVSQSTLEAEQEFLSTFSDGLQTAADEFSRAVESIVKNFEKSMTGVYGTFDAMANAYNQYSKANERYLTDYTKIYELSKLNREISKSIDSKESVSAKSKLRDIQEEINKLQANNTKMTQYEVNEIRARYELKLAEIALEEAQSAKNQVRMSRDSEGNWSYIYTTNQDAIDKAQQTYEDKLYAYQNLVQNRTKEIESQLMSLPQEFANEMQAINEDLTLSEEQRLQRMEETRQFYLDQHKYLTEQLGYSINDAKIFYEEDWRKYSEITGYKISDNTMWRDQFNETVLYIIADYDTLDEVQQNFVSQTETMVINLNTEYENWKTNIANMMEAGGTSVSNFGDLVEETVGRVKQKTSELSQEVGITAQNMITAMGNATGTTAQLSAQYSGFIGTVTGAANTLIETVNYASGYYSTISSNNKIIADSYANIAIQAGNAAVQISRMIAAMAGAGNIGTNNKNDVMVYGYGGDAINKQNGKSLNLASLGIVSYFDAGDFVQLFTDDNKILYLNAADAASESVANYLSTLQVATGSMAGWTSGFDTGGYTGEWDSSGRLAILHQKELVLNAQDTENFLAAVNIVREITDTIDLNTLAWSNRFNNLTSSSINTYSQPLEQEVIIHAEFPNATNRTEIEEAFDSLINRASQFANRKN